MSLLTIQIFVLVLGLRAAQAETDNPRPNVLFLILDDMNDWLGCYGGHPDAKTPNIDRLARRGVLFSNAHCVSPICGPSRAAVLTGMRPETTGVYHNKGTYIDYVPAAVTFPEHFRANGYRTLAAGKVNHGLGERDPRLWNENGPDCGVLGTPFVDDELDTTAMIPERVINRGALKITLPANGGLSAIDRPNNTWDSFDWAPLDVDEDEFPDGKIANWGVEQLRKEHSAPFLLALGFYKPHQPFFAPRKYFEPYDAKRVALPSTIAGDLCDVPPPGRELATRPWTSGTHKTVMAHNAWRDAIRAYLATVSFVDALVGRVIEALDRSQHADNTWIILWSDHGWSLGQKEHWGKHVPWVESVRMPLLIVPPKTAHLHGFQPDGFQPGGRCKSPVSLLDLYPTLVDMCGLPTPREVEGRSLLPLVADPQTEWNEAVVATVGRGTHSVFTERWRYIRYFDGSEELYDLREDAREWFNLAAVPEHKAVKQQLARHIPEDKRFARFVRWGQWKCVFPADGDPMLFDYHGEFGISEQSDVASERPEVVKAVRTYLEENKITARRVLMPETGQGSDSEPIRSSREQTNDASADRPNILIVMADDLGWGDVAYNGNKIVKTPHLDRMARAGVRLDRFYAAAPVCSPTRGSCLTGRHPFRYGIDWAGETPLKREEITIAEALKKAGYATGHFGKWHVGGLSKTVKQSYFEGPVDPATYSPPWENGFDECFSTESMMPTYNPYYHLGGEFGTPEYRHLQTEPVALGQQTNGFRWRDYYWTGPGQFVDEWLEGDDSRIIMDRTLDFIDRQAARHKPFLALTWFHTPHTPLVASNEDRGPYSDQPVAAQHWYGAITAMDRQIGRLRGHLREKGLAQNTILWFCSDNGPSYIHDFNSAGPFRGKKATLWEGGVRVPAIIEWPAKLTGERIVNAPVSTSDFYPTLLTAVGASFPENQPLLDGVDVMPLLDGRRTRRNEPIAFQAPVKSKNDVLAEPGSKQMTLCDDRHKLISVDGGKRWMLFDLSEDPGESCDLAAKQPQQVASMKATLQKWITSCARSARGDDYR